MMNELSANEIKLNAALLEGRAAHLCIDLRRRYLTPKSAPFFKATGELIKSLREKNIPTIWINYIRPHEKKFDTETDYTDVRPQIGDSILNVTDLDSWNRDVLHGVLALQQADTPLISGYGPSGLALTIAFEQHANLTPLVVPETMCYNKSSAQISYNFWKQACGIVPLERALHRVQINPAKYIF